jgi:hypothetical protein
LSRSRHFVFLWKVWETKIRNQVRFSEDFLADNYLPAAHNTTIFTCRPSLISGMRVPQFPRFGDLGDDASEAGAPGRSLLGAGDTAKKEQRNQSEEQENIKQRSSK